MKFIDNAGALWPKLWSVRLALLSTILGIIEVTLRDNMPENARPWLVILMTVVSMAAAVARIVAQPELQQLAGGTNGTDA